MYFIHNFTLLLTLTSSILLIQIGIATSQNANHCREIKDCKQCISSRWGCSWCTNPVFEKNNHFAKQISRCDTKQNHLADQFGLCNSPNQLEISSSFSKITTKNPVGKFQTGTVHISPQFGQVKLAVEKPVELEMTYFEDPDKRLDLYYLHDLSYTMKGDKEAVATQSQVIASELKKITSDVQLGFGSFVDKPVLPYINYQQKTGRSITTEPPYGYKNHLSLTHDTVKFQKIVKDSKISENIDEPEGSLDALMQVMVCGSGVGWRNNSHKLIVVATDGTFHIAGDGKLGGIVKPNDMKCHLDSLGSYTHSTILDYPSIGQINHVVIETRTYVIFAVTEDRRELYTQLSERVSNSKAVLLRSETSSDDHVVKIILDQYKDIKGQVELLAKEANGFPNVLNHIEITYYAKCKRGDNWTQSKVCMDVGPSDQVQFKVSLKLLSCPTVSSSRIEFSTFDLGHESFKIDLQFDCQCNCSSNVILDQNVVVDICGNNSKLLKCGKCVCNEGYTGVNCECSGNEAETQSNSNCRMGNNAPECSDRGKCQCNQCVCSQSKYFGNFCQCDRSKCRLDPRNENEIECFGRGKCSCEKCQCDPDRGGDKCQCSSKKITCQEPGIDRECNSQGQCTCSPHTVGGGGGWQWTCKSCESGYFGQYCHICTGPNCASSSKSQTRCNNPDLTKCLKCHLNESGMIANSKVCDELCEKQDENPNEIKIFSVDIQSIQPETEGIKCTLQYNDSCTIDFYYAYDPLDRQKLAVVVSATSLLCAPPIDWLPIIFFGAGGVLLIGLLTILLWKIFTTVHDKREFTKFEKERAAAKWAKGENPLYSAPMSTFENPAYRN